MSAVSRLFLVLCLALVVSCAKSVVISDNAAGPIPWNAPVYIAVAEDGQFGDRIYEGSGLLASAAVAKALEPYSRDRLIGLAKEAQNAALESARKAGSAYLVYPRIVRWEDRSTVSAKPEAAELHLSVIEVATGKVVNTAQLVGQGQILLRPSAPSEQLAKPLSEWAAKAFASPAN